MASVTPLISPAERPTDRRAYTHKMDLELDTSRSVFNWLPEARWLRGVELEGSLSKRDYMGCSFAARVRPKRVSMSSTARVRS